MGGVGTVRGYRENHLVRDEGYSLSLEFRYPIIGENDPSTRHRFTLIPFMDYGEAWNLDGGSEALHSAGIGFNWEFRPLYAEFYYGYAINRPDRISTTIFRTTACTFRSAWIYFSPSRGRKGDCWVQGTC